MHIPQPLFWILFAIVAACVVVGCMVLLVRGERVGSLDCPCRVARDMLSTHLTIAREGNGARPPTVQVRLRLPAFWRANRITADDANQLAALLESAAGELRKP